MTDAQGSAESDSDGDGTPIEVLVSPKLVSIAFVFSLVMAAICLFVSVCWLIYYQFAVFGEARAAMAEAESTFYPDLVLKAQMQALFLQSTPISCGTLAGVGLGFLGFALFMVNINLKPTLGVEGEYEKAKIKFVNLSPGILVICLAVILIGFCISRYPSFEPKIFEDWRLSK